MDWSELLKYLTSSKSLIIASFFTSLALIFGGGILFPKDIEPQGYVKLILIGVSIFTGILIAIVVIEFLLKISKSKFKAIAMVWRGRHLTDQERSVILGMAIRANEPTNFSLADYSKSEFTKLEVLSIVQELRKKGYVEDYMYDETIAYLTLKGRKVALQLMLEYKQNAQQWGTRR
jgi:hypothetical protein